LFTDFSFPTFIWGLYSVFGAFQHQIAVPEKTILKIGYIIGKLMPFSHKNVVHYPVSASCLGTLEIVISF
jgi:hypothetical protein